MTTPANQVTKTQPTLFMIKIGATPKGRLIEQHDMFFGVANEIAELVPAVDKHWAEVAGKWHFDAYRAVTKVDNHRIEWLPQAPSSDTSSDNSLKLYFINFGGYLPNQFEEYHHKLLVVATTEAEAVKQAKQSEFYQKYSYNDADTIAQSISHVDDKMGVDVDDIYDVNGLIAEGHLHITPIEAGETVNEDKQVIGYISLKQMA